MCLHISFSHYVTMWNESTYKRAIKFPVHERDRITTQKAEEGLAIERVAKPAPAFSLKSSNTEYTIQSASWHNKGSRQMKTKTWCHHFIVEIDAKKSSFELTSKFTSGELDIFNNSVTARNFSTYHQNSSNPPSRNNNRCMLLCFTYFLIISVVFLYKDQTK